MIQINQIKLNIDSDFKKIIKKIENILKINANSIKLKDIRILRKSIDTRNKRNILYVYNVAVDLKNDDYEKTIVKKLNNKNILLYVNHEFNPIISKLKNNNSVIVVGSGPAGLFASYTLALNGYKPIVIEQGERVENRINTVRDFSLNNILNVNSNVSFGEGGAGTFSDGKLYTRTDSKDYLNKFVLKTFIKFGADEKILYDYSPHIGTDILSKIVINLRNEIIKLGGEFIYNYKWKVNDSEYGINSNKKIILAIGNSSRDTFIDLYNNGFNIIPKDFAMGYRVIHEVDLINRGIYGEKYIEVAKKNGNASYHLKYHSDKYNKALYSFCMCPGGFVINSSNSNKFLSINGMSYNKRDNIYSNSAIVINISKDDFLISGNPLSGVLLQEKIESISYKIGQGNIPYCRFEDFLNRNNTTGGVENAEKMFYNKSKYSKDVVKIFDNAFKFFNFSELFIEAMNYFNTIIDGFSDNDTIVAAVESRTSSPIKIERNKNCECNIKNVYPSGEGLGYGGGIVSSAIDGIKVALNIIKEIEG